MTAPSYEGAKRWCVTASPYHPSSVMACAMPPSPRGRLFLCPGGLLRRFIPLNYCKPAHRGMPPPLHSKSNCVPPLIRPPIRVATFLQGKAISLSRQPLRRFLSLKCGKIAHRGMPPPLQSHAGSLFSSPKTTSLPLVCEFFANNPEVEERSRK